VIFRQLIHDDLGCASYVVGDEDAGVVAVVDPRLEVGEYLRIARFLGVHIEHVVETHTHADHVSGHGRLAAATGAAIHVHEAAGADYQHDAIGDGWELVMGDVVMRALHTPGHRPEHCSYLLFDQRRDGDRPWAVLSGDSLFVGDLARPDLAMEPEEGAREIFRSLHGRLLALPDDCEVWPAHLGGSMCGGPGMDLKICSTIGFERAHNAALAEDDEDRFVAAELARLGPQPPNFQRIVEVNRGPLGDREVSVAPLTPRQVAQHQGDGALIVDVRTDVQFDDAHVPGAVCLTALRGGFGTRLAWIAQHGRPIVFVGRDDGDGTLAARLGAAVAVTEVAGVLSGGMTTWREERRAVGSLERLTVDELHDRRKRVQVLDVRELAEWQEGHIPGSVHTPYHDLDGVPDGLDPARPIAVICASGQRSAIGASLLASAGAREVLHVAGGGVGTWARRGWPLDA
jgi:hydroxyacylglutathione hydrolase